jgi:IclR family KDG regulon transcriptional repressor
MDRTRMVRRVEVSGAYISRADKAGDNKRLGRQVAVNTVEGSEDEQPGVKTLDKGLKILDFIIARQRSVGVSEIANEFGMDKGSAYRFLTTFDRYGVLRQDTQSRKYGLGTRFLVWASRANPLTTIVSVARPSLEELARVTGLEAHLAVMSDRTGVLVDTAFPNTPMSTRSLIGLEEPLHNTALGKVMLAFLPDDERRALLETIPLTKATENTIVDRAVLAESLTEIRRTGVATDRGEFFAFLTCFAAPVFDETDRVVASIGVSAVAESLTDKTELQIYKKLIPIADGLSRHLSE